MTVETKDTPHSPRPALTHQYTVSEEVDQSMDNDEEDELSRFVEKISFLYNNQADSIAS